MATGAVVLLVVVVVVTVALPVTVVVEVVALEGCSSLGLARNY